MANWQADKSRRIIKRVIAHGTLKLKTPAHFGSGLQDGSELVILEDALEKRPLLPGASLAGALRQYLLDREAGYRATETTDYIAAKLFGTALDDDDTGYQSRVIVDDAFGAGNSILTVRDGVRIDNVTNTAKDAALFSVQVWEAGTIFDLSFELVIYEGDTVADYEMAFATILQALQDGEIRVGARKHRGYGRCMVDDWHVSIYDLKQPQHLLAWMQDEQLDNQASEFLAHHKAFPDKRHRVIFDATLKLCDSILIRASSDVAESSHLTSNGIPVVSGTAIAGALRARAKKILNTLQDSEVRSVEYIDDLFGKHGDDDGIENEDLTASRLIVDENPINDYTFDWLQTRVKIDRFTGGAFETALFDEQPVFAKDATRVTVHLELHYPHETGDISPEAHTGLLLLLLKDLSTEDLPLGGEISIGRGRLRGDTGRITIQRGKENSTGIVIHDNRIEASDISTLQAFVTTLNKEITS